MTKGEYPYPPDEFDAVDPSVGPRGAHRRPRSTWATLWPYLAALVASALLAFVVIGLLWDERGTPPVAQASEPAAEQGTPAGTPAPSETAAEPTAESPVVEPPAVESPPPPPPAPDLDTPVVVLNSTSVQGLAADAADTLQDAGWTQVGSQNFTGGALPASTVRFGAPELEASARAVAEELGITAVELAESDATDGIEVVLELDFAG